MGFSLLKIGRYLSNPRFYARLALQRAQVRVSPWFARTSFFLQGQMDIHPNSYWHVPPFAQATGGFWPSAGQGERRIHDLESFDCVRRDMLVLLLRSLVERGVPGDFAELGVYQGSTARLIHHYAPERTLHLFDTFQGFDARDLARERQFEGHAIGEDGFHDTSVPMVRAHIAPRNDHVHFHVGFFPDSIPPALREARFAFVQLDADLEAPMGAGLRFFWPRLSPGGFLVAHDYNAWLGARTAVDRFCAEHGLVPLPMPDKSGSAVLLKPGT